MGCGRTRLNIGTVKLIFVKLINFQNEYIIYYNKETIIIKYLNFKVNTEQYIQNTNKYLTAQQNSYMIWILKLSQYLV